MHSNETISAYGGPLVGLMVDAGSVAAIRRDAHSLPSWRLTRRQLYDLELLLTGGFSPLRGFLGQEDYDRVCHEMRLSNGTLWPIPVTLDVPDTVATRLIDDPRLLLRDPDDTILALLHVTDVWRPDADAEARRVYGTNDRQHPGVAQLLAAHPWYVGGRLDGVRLPAHYDFRALRLTPADTRARFANLGWHRVVAFQTRNPMHRAHQELTRRAAAEASANLLIHPVVGPTMPGDIDHYTRVRCYQAAMAEYPAGLAVLALLPLAMRMAGPREALLHAIVRRNYGCTHFIVGRDHASPAQRPSGARYWGAYEAQTLVARHGDEIGVEMVPFRDIVYIPVARRFVPEDERPPGLEAATLSGSELRRRLRTGEDIPEWFSAPAVVAELRRAVAATREGRAVFFTGLSGAGKSTLARALEARLRELGRLVTLLDGDDVRQLLSSELGFSREHRDLNVRRIGFVAAEITRHGGTAVCAAIAPFDAARKAVREMVEEIGGTFVLVYVATPLAVCESRDQKGLYARARAGRLPQFTGVTDPYEAPEDAELIIDTSTMSIEAAVEQILARVSVGPPR